MLQCKPLFLAEEETEAPSVYSSVPGCNNKCRKEQHFEFGSLEFKCSLPGVPAVWLWASFRICLTQCPYLSDRDGITHLEGLL